MPALAILAILASLVTLIAALGVFSDFGNLGQIVTVGGASLALVLSALLAATAFRRRKQTRDFVLFQQSASAQNEAKIDDTAELKSELDRYKKLERELTSARQQAEAAMMAKGEFLATMSHEIRTPLNGIIPMLDLLLSTPLSADQREYLQLAFSSSRQLLSIVDDILDFSKLEANKLELETVGVNLKELLGGVVRLMEKTAAAKELNLYSKIAPDVRLAVRGDPVRLRQVLTNLVSNAIKFTEHGEVGVHVTRIGETRTRFTLRFEVRDTGIGISRTSAAKLFQAFSQADASTTRTFGGTGLGLAICKRIVDLMGGKIGVESTPGKGSTFWFEVPIDKALGDIQGGRNTMPGATRLLLVTTNQPVARRFAQALPQWGASFALASNPQDAVTKLRAASARAGQRGFSAILIDGGSIASTLLALHRNLLRDPDLRDIPRIHLRTEEPLPPEIEQAPGFNIVNRELADHELQTRVFNILDSLDDQENAPAAIPAMQEATTPEPVPEPAPEPVPEPEPVAAPPLAPKPATTRLPVRPAPPAPAPATPAPAPIAASGTNRHVLLVEDNPVNRQVAQRLLSLAGLTYDTAENGKDAIDLLNAGNHYAAVLMDCQMPVMDGYTATRTWRETEAAQRRPRLAIIAMTANAMIGDREKCLAAGMDDYLSKPLNRGLMESTLQRWIDAAAPAPATASRPALVAVPVSPRPAPAAPVSAAARPVAPPPPAPTTPAIDTEVVDDLREIMGAEFASLVHVFLDDAPRAITRLTASAAAGDIAAMAAPAHTLKSTSANLGAMALSAAARHIEQSARQNQLPDPVERVAVLEAEFNRARAELQRYLR